MPLKSVTRTLGSILYHLATALLVCAAGVIWSIAVGYVWLDGEGQLRFVAWPVAVIGSILFVLYVLDLPPFKSADEESL